jgi:hypothetical protein
MKKTISLFLLATVLSASIMTVATTAGAEEAKMIGTVSRIVMAADQKSATVTLKDTKSGEDVTILVTDELTLDKFKDKRIVEGDEIRCKYDKQGDKNNSKIFKKTAGC